MPQEQLPPHLESFCQSWNRPRGDLCHWISILNYFDTILEQLVTKYGLDQDEITPKLFSLEDEQVATSILNFSTFLLDKCSNRGIYNSEKYVNNLILSISPEVSSAALRLMGRLAERNVDSRSARSSLHLDANRLLKFATCVTSRNGEHTMSDPKTIIKYINNVEVPSSFSLQYYNSPSVKLTTAQKSNSHSNQPESSSRPQIHTTGSLVSNSPPTSTKSRKSSLGSIKTRHGENKHITSHEGLSEYVISTKDALNQPLDKIISEAFKVVPKQYWLDVVIKAHLAKSTANTEEGARLRSLMLQMQCHALNIACTSLFVDGSFDNKIMIENVNLIKQLSEILVPENPFDLKIRNAAIDAFCSLCCHPTAVSEIIVNLSSNVTHGTLMHVMRGILKEIRSGQGMDEEFFLFVDGMISLSLQLSPASLQSNFGGATPGGTIQLFWELAKEEKASPRIRTNSMDGLMRIVTEVPGYLSTFLQQEDGCQALIKILENTIETALDPTRCGSPPTLSSMDYSINYHMIQWIKVLLHFIVSITTQARTAERIQQILDSKFLVYTRKIIQNPKVFGYRVISITLGIIGGLLENESSTFGIMSENHSLDGILTEIPNLLQFSSGLHGPVARFLSSVAHNEAGLSIVKERKIFNAYFELISKNLGERESLKHLGSCLDHICTEHSSLRPIVITEVIKLLDIIITKLNTFNSPFQFFYELDSASESPEEDLALAKRYSFLTSTVSFVESVLRNHFSRVEFIKQKGVEHVLDILDSPALSYDFSFNFPSISIYKTLKQLFDLDIDREYVTNAILSKLSNTIDNIEANIRSFPDPDSDIITSSNFISFLESVGPLQNVLHCFMFTVFTNYGTGYRITPVLQALSGENSKKDPDAENETPEHFQTLLTRLGKVHQYLTWEYSRILKHIPQDVKDATHPIPYDPVLNNFFRKYQDTAEFKKLKELEAKLPDDVSHSQRYRIIKCSRFMLGACGNMVTENFAVICAFLFRSLSNQVSDKVVFKILDIISAVYYDNISLFNERRQYPEISVWYLGTYLRSLENTFTLNSKMNEGLTSGPVVFFKQQGGFMLVGDIALQLFKDSRSSDEKDPTCTVLNETLVMFNMLVDYSRIYGSEMRGWESPSTVLPNHFVFAQFFTELRLTVYHYVSKMWNDDEIESKPQNVINIILSMLTRLFTTTGETNSARTDALNYIDWHEAAPSQTLFNSLKSSFDVGGDYDLLLEVVENSIDSVDTLATDISTTFSLDKSEVQKVIESTKYSKPPRPINVTNESGVALRKQVQLDELRSSITSGAIDRVVGVVRGNPDVVLAASNLILKFVPSKTSKEPKNELNTSAVSELLMFIMSFDPQIEENQKPLEGFSRLLGILLSNSTIRYSSLTELLEFTTVFIDMIEVPGASNRKWFPYILLILEVIFSIKEIPDAVNGTSNIPKSLAMYSEQIPETDPLDPSFLDRTFNVLVQVTELEDEFSVVVVHRLLAFFTRDHKRATALVQHQCFPNLLKRVQKYSKPSNKDADNETPNQANKNTDKPGDIVQQICTSLILILRNSVETEEIVKAYMTHRIRNKFSSSSDTMSLGRFMESQREAIARSPKFFLEVLQDQCLIHHPNNKSKNSNGNTEGLFITHKTNLDKMLKDTQRQYDEWIGMEVKITEEKATSSIDGGESDVSMEDAQPDTDSNSVPVATTPDSAPLKPILSNIPSLTTTTASKSVALENPSGIINILLNELFSIGLDKIFTVPLKTPEALANWVKQNQKTSEKIKDNKKSSDNPFFHYASFLLQALAELVASYDVCKLEFLNYSKKSQSSLPIVTSSNSVPFKPRHTSLNFFLQDLIPIGILESSNAMPYYEWSSISSSASRCLTALLSASDEKFLETPEELQNEPTLVFVRKFVVETLAKCLRDANLQATDSLLWRYSKISALGDLCNRLFSGGSSIPLDHFSTTFFGFHDGNAIAKVAYDKQFASVLTACLSEIDLNYPQCRKPIKILVKCLNKISRLSVEVDEGTQEKPEEDSVMHMLGELSSESDYEEEYTDIFRNSALSMYEAGDDGSIDEEEILMDEGDHVSEIEENVAEEMDYRDDEAQSDVASDVELEEDESMYDEDLDSEDDSQLGSDEEDDLSQDEDEDVEIIDEMDDDGMDVQRIVVRHYDNQSGYETSDEEAMSNDEPENEESNDISNDNPRILGGNSNHHTLRINTETMDAASETEDDDIPWESFEEFNEVDENEMELAETMFQQHDHRNLNIEFDWQGSPTGDFDFGEHNTHHYEVNVSDPIFGLPLGGFHGASVRTSDRQSRNSTLFQPLLAPSGTQGVADALIFALDFLSHDRSHFGVAKSSEGRIFKTLARWEELSQMFKIFTSLEVSGRLSQIFFSTTNPASLKRYEELHKLENSLADKKSQVVKAVKREADEQRERLAREKSEKEAAERLAQEEREAAEREREELENQRNQEIDDVEEETASVEMPDVDAPATEAAVQPYMMNIGGHSIDVSGLGIDPSFLEAIPEELREEAFTQHLRELQRNASRGDHQVEELVSTFLGALPTSVRRELLNEEPDSGGEEGDEVATTDPIDQSSFFASLEPALRRTLLLEQDDQILNTLTPGLADEAREIRHGTVGPPETPFGFNLPGFNRLDRHIPNILQHIRRKPDSDQPKKKKITAASLHVIDKQGVAALIRTLYLPQPNSLESLHQLLFDLCSENKSNRLDIMNSIIHTLMDASADKAALDRGFIHTSNMARYAQNSDATDSPNSLSRVPIGHNVLAQEITPGIVAKQVLEALVYISHKSIPVRHFFLSEHDSPLAKRFTGKGKKGKGKGSKYPVNVLINLLGRPTIYENNATLENLSLVLFEVTKGIPLLLKSLNQSDNKEKETNDSISDQPSSTLPSSETIASSISESTHTNTNTGDVMNSSDTKALPSTSKQHHPPYIPNKNYKLICKTLFLKECSSRTFEQMLTVIKNLSSIEGVKDLFAKELVHQAASFGPNIIDNLHTLNTAIRHTGDDDEVSSEALAPFSSGSSHQASLLRALAALDYLFDPSRDKPANATKDKVEEPPNEDFLNMVYTKLNFGPLWSALSESLTLVQQRPALLYVATALLPLVESLMVICKHSSVRKISLRESGNSGNNEPVFSSKVDISQAPLETLFFIFTDQHRKILNHLVRTNSKLMNGSFSILVKNPKSLEFDNKRKYFSKKLYDSGVIHTTQLNLNISRDTTFLDSYRALHFRTADEIKQGRLHIKFKGEEGIDVGGLTREWYQVMSRQMFNPDYALFVPVTSDHTTFHPNRTSSINDNHLSYFKFMGRIIGKAIYDNKLLDCHFSRAMYKKILGKPVNLRDMENLDPDFYKSLQWMLENDITDIITETFSIESDDYGELKVVDLKPDGRNIAVTEENKAEYVRLVCEYKLINSVRDQLDQFLEGFHDVIPKDIVSIFDEQELELLISGLPDIDIEDWRGNTEYQNYSPSSPQIKWFWRAVRSFDSEERAKLLQFVTGTSKVPLNGFKELVGMHGISKFSIHRDFGSQDRLPSSHTCFNQLDLPVYASYENLREALIKAFSEGGGSFDLA